jgi:transposase-like protein
MSKRAGYDAELVKTLRTEGTSYSEIAEHFGVTETTLRRWRVEEGDVKIYKYEIDHDAVVDLRVSGISYADIAEKLQVPYETLRSWRKRTRFQEPFATNKEVSDEMLDALVEDAGRVHVKRGYQFMRGLLTSEGSTLFRTTYP